MIKIPFNKPSIIGNELAYIEQAVASGKISGNGGFTKKCQAYFEQTLGSQKCLLTTSCTDAIEMSAILSEIGPGDEVILPSFTFVSTANPFLLRGATIKLADSYGTQPNIDPASIISRITDRTKVIVVVHYAGVACDMDKIMAIAKEKNILVIEDAAQAIDAYYKGVPLGSIGDLGTFSFHETKNIIAGEGGLLSINNPKFNARSEIIWEKGTNRSAFFRGEIDKYTWVDIGSSFLPSELIAAFLYAQIEKLSTIQDRRKAIWERYFKELNNLAEKGYITLPHLPDYATNNGHLFYFLCSSLEERTKLLKYLKSNGILAVFHYVPLHSTDFYKNHEDISLPNADKFGNCLVRLPLFYELSETNQSFILEKIINFYQ